MKTRFPIFVFLPQSVWKGGNKELVIVPGASHCDLYDGGGKGAIPFDRVEVFYRNHLK